MEMEMRGCGGGVEIKVKDSLLKVRKIYVWT